MLLSQLVYKHSTEKSYVMFCFDYLFLLKIKNKRIQTEHNMINNQLTNHFSILTINSEETKLPCSRPVKSSQSLHFSLLFRYY